MSRAPGSPKTRGFTAVELMTAMALLSLIIAMAMGAFLSMNANASQTYVTANMQQNSRLALDALASDLRAAGLGASNGTVGIAPGGAWAMRVPTVYSGPVQTLTDPAGNSFTTRSVYILGAEPGTVGLSGAGEGIEGVVTDTTTASVACYATTSGAVTATDCAASSVGADGVDHSLLVPNGPGQYQPLVLHDHQRASIIVPTSVGSFSGSPQLIQYLGMSGPIQPNPNPTAPFGFAQGFQVSRLRAVHWYLKQDRPDALPRLYRSRPTLTKAASTTCPGPDMFVDETNDPASGVKGVEVGAGPIESLQLRYVLDLVDQNDPTRYSMTDVIDPCASNVAATIRQLREVRVQMVAIASAPVKDTNGRLQARFTTPTFEGSTAPAKADAYPRRAYVTRVAPRNFLPYRF